MNDALDGGESESTPKIVIAGVVTTVVVSILAAEAPAVLFVLAIPLAVLAVVVPLLWFFTQTGTFDGLVGSDSELDDDEAALERLRRRYADGDLTEDEFERRLDRLLETETLEDAKQYRTDAGRRTDAGGRTGRKRDQELER
ncbi:SHOCT domain-containing protein [Halorussus litoreus]|uniref:SHOCT domain-containing protein n=1 Tax=Halorussus litoreus TaxID=1710536 RepID=UPI000E226730|nr:SHOCT domain-containing protein [Halorussus litoreus]